MSDWRADSALDRVEEQRRDPGWVEGLWSDPATAVLPVVDGRVPVVDGMLVASPPSGPHDPQRHLLLGRLDGRPWFAEAGDAPAQQTLRSVMDGLSHPELQLAFTAVGLVGWHAGAAFCSRCGAPTSVVAGGQARRCVECGRESYPRTDPAVIVAILDPDGRLLLGRQPSWATGRHSVFAGFVEMGESLEQAVHREMAEEVGLTLTEVRYLGSQPWPFPRSLMVGFVAHSATTGVVPAEGEIELARWFTIPDLERALSAEEVTLPPVTSIARRMIDAWRGGTLSDPRT